MGRRTKYTPERVDMILAAVRDGLTHKDAAMVSGIDQTTLIAWKDRYPNFANQLAHADAERSRKWLAKLWTLAQEGDTRAIESLLDRCAPQYRKTAAIEVGGKDGALLFAPGWVALRTALLAALSSHPDAAEAIDGVIARLGAGDG